MAGISPGFVMLFGILVMLGGARAFQGMDPMEFLARYSLERYLQVSTMIRGGVLLLFIGAALLAGRAP